MATRSENIENEHSCWNNARDDEQIFILLGRDRHAPALIQLWALMREKEGEDEEVVNEAREVAQLMIDELVAAGKVYLSLDAVASFATTLKEPVPEAAGSVSGAVSGNAGGYTLREGEVVVAGRGRPAKLVKIFGEMPEATRGFANIQVPGHGPVTVEFQTLRPAQPDEIELYRNTGGRI